MELKERIKKARKHAGFKSRDALADCLGSTRDAIASYELGRVVPNDVFLQLMAVKLHISYEWLKEGKGEMEELSPSMDAIMERLGDEDAEIVRIYAELPQEHKRILKEFARKIATESPARSMKKAAPAVTPEKMAIYEEVKAQLAADPLSPEAPLSEEERELIQRMRLKKESSSRSAC